MSYNKQDGGGGGGLTLSNEPCNISLIDGTGGLFTAHAGINLSETSPRQISNVIWDAINDSTHDIDNRSATITNPSSCYNALAKIRVDHGILWTRAHGVAAANQHTFRFYPKYSSAVSVTPPAIPAVYGNYTLGDVPAKDQLLEPWTSKKLGQNEEAIILLPNQSVSVTIGGQLLQLRPTGGGAPNQIAYYIWNETISIDLHI